NFEYNGTHYWLDGFRNWPGFLNGRANFGSDASSLSVGLTKNFGIQTHTQKAIYDLYQTTYDSLLFQDSYKNSGFILPEYGLFDQQGTNSNLNVPAEVFANCFRGHVK